MSVGSVLDLSSTMGCEVRAGSGLRPDGAVVCSSACTTTLRRFSGPQAGELAVLCSPAPGLPDPAQQAEAAYGALMAALAAHQASFRDLVRETIFVRDVRRELPLLLGARARVLADLGQGSAAPLPAFIQQAPVDGRASFQLSAWAVIPHRRDAWSVRDVRAVPSCACEGCVRSGARLVRLGEQTSLHTANLYGSGADAFEQASDMFRVAEGLLDRCGMEFRDVVRVWIHLRDIDRDYAALNEARRAFFRDRGIEPRPASTGIQGIPLPDAHQLSISLHAVRSTRPLDVGAMSTPLLNEAWSYGADFSRGLRVGEANKVALHVSGTASIDEVGRTVHAGSFDAQVGRMLDNVASLLAGQGASFDDVHSAVTYLKRPADAAVLRAICRERGFDGFPWVIVEAPLCRPELLCETEAVALLPPAPPGA
jgi:enamine deaminase RidA (YjgF/YER057c/UK114 family)